MRDDGAEAAADDLHRDIGERVAAADARRGAHHQGHRRIEMRAGDRREDGDDDDQHGAGREGIAQERERLVPAGELLRHDARADHRHHQKEGAERFRRQTARQIELHDSPCPSVLFNHVIAGLDPAIQGRAFGVRCPWMPASRPGMTNGWS